VKKNQITEEQMFNIFRDKQATGRSDRQKARHKRRRSDLGKTLTEQI